jgi:capsular polysaccharide transport system permease protein
MSGEITTDFWAPAIMRQRRVLFALMLRNIRTKFFGSGLGYVVAVAWPLSHILILVAMFSYSGRLAPYGDSTALFVATGVLPFQTFSYLSRFMMLGIVRNRPLLAFPEVKILDILFASALLEIMSACCVVITFLIIAWCVGIDALPRDILQASFALGAAMLLGLGCGILNGVIVLAAPGWFIGFTLAIISLWISSGILFVPDALPAVARDILAYNPILQAIEWMRSAYYEGYGAIVLDRTYALSFGVITLFLGLLLERAMRGHLLAVR